MRSLTVRIATALFLVLAALALPVRDAAGLTGGGAEGQSTGARFALDLERVMARAAMHEIVKKGGERFWVFRRTGDAGESFSISTGPGR